MPDYIISTTGGLFTSTSTWVGGVVPPSATASDIIGLTSSGPLYFNSLGSRIIGSLILEDFANDIGFTGSATTLLVRGTTFSLGQNLNMVGATGPATVANSRFALRPSGNATLSFYSNGKSFTRCTVAFEWSQVAADTGFISICDEMKIFGESYLRCHDFNAGPNVNRAIVGSATSSVRAKVYLDHENSTSQFWVGTRPLQNKGYEVDFIIAGSGSGRTNWSAENYYFNKNSLPERSSLEIQSGDFRILHNLAMTKEMTIKYTGGTVSGSKRALIWHNTLTNNLEPTNVYFDTNGVQWGIVDMRHDTDSSTSPATMSLWNINGFSTDNMLVSNAAGNSAVNNYGVRHFKIIGTNSSTNLGNFIVGGPYLSGGGVFTSGFWYGHSTLFLEGGLTYSAKRFQGMGAYFDDSTNIVIPGYSSGDPRQKGYFNIYGTSSSANLVLSENENTTLWCRFDNINVTGSSIYSFGGTFSNTTGIESVLPTGGGGGGGSTQSCEISYAYIS
jgi:hypothetical protein